MTASQLENFNDRLVPLHDGRPGLRAALQICASSPPSPPPSGGEGRGEVVVPNSNSIPHSELRTPNSDDSQPSTLNSQPPSQLTDSQLSTLNSQPVLDFISSDNSLDRYDEIISPEGWRLDSYRLNPVFQNSHQYGDIIFTLGKALVTEVRTVENRPVLFQRIQFATEVNPMARIAYGLYKHGFLQAVSVGFIPLRWENGTAKSPYRRKHLEQELLEVSAVAIPANPNALALGLKSGAVEQSDLRDLADLCRRSLEAAPPCSQPSTLNPQLISLARRLRDLMRRA